MDLTTAARVKAHLELTTSVGDTLIGQLIPAVSSAVERYLGFSRAGGAQKADRTETYDVYEGDRVIWLRSFPVDLADDFAVKNAIDRDFAAAEVLDEELYSVDATLGRIVFDRWGLLPGPNVLQVVYNAGLGAAAANVVTDYPDVATAVDMQVAFLYKRKDTLGMSSFSAEGGSVSFLNPDGLIPQVKMLLDPLRREIY